MKACEQAALTFTWDKSAMSYMKKAFQILGILEDVEYRPPKPVKSISKKICNV